MERNWILESPGKPIIDDHYALEYNPPVSGLLGPTIIKTEEPAGLLSDFWDYLTVDKAADRAKASNAMVISGQIGLSPSFVYDNMDDITAQLGLRDQPPPREFIGKMLMAPVTAGLWMHPLATAMGIGVFMTLAEAENYVFSKKGKYQAFAGKGLDSLLPEQTSDTIKDIFWIGDIAWKAVAAAGLTSYGKISGKKFAERYMRDITEKWNMPRNVYISPEKIREFHGLGRKDVISAAEDAILKDLNVPRQDYIDGLKYGWDIEIPAEKIVTIADKPWVVALKDFFKASPYHETIITKEGVVVQRHISGLIEEPIPGVPIPVVAPKKALAAIPEVKVEPAEEPGPEMKIIEEIKVNPLDDINTLVEMAGAQDTALGTGDIGESPSYDAIRGQAARLAWEKVQKKIDFAERKEKAQIRDAVLADARDLPVHIIMSEVVKAGGFKYDALRSIYDKATITHLSRMRPGLISKTGRLFLDEVAAESGIWESNDALMSAMMDWKGLKEKARRIERHYFDLLSDVEVYDYYLDVLNEEGKILGKLLKQFAPKEAPGLKKLIREQTGQVRVGELWVSEYDALKAAMRKAEQASRKAFSEGKYEGVLKEKERAKEIALRLRARLEAKQEANKIHDQLVTLLKIKSIPEDYQDQIDNLLSSYDLKTRSAKTERRVESQREFLARQEAAGEDVSFPQKLLDRIERYGRIHWKDLTLDELRTIRDQAAMLAHLGKLKKELISKGNKREFEESVGIVLKTIRTNWPETIPHDIETMLIDPTFIEKLDDLKHKYQAELLKPEHILRCLDKWEDLGPIWTLTYKPIKGASDVEITGFFDLITKLNEAFKPYKKLGHKWLKEKYKIEGVPQILPKEKMLGVALNTGNEGNMDVLRYGMKWTDEQIKAITDKLTSEEWQLVKNIWQMYKNQLPALAEVYKESTGLTLEEVEGNYHPIKFDRKLAWFMAKDAAEAEQRDLFANLFPSLKLESSFTIARKGGVPFPPDLSLDVVFKHLADVNHYTSHALAIRDVQRILRDPRVAMAIQTCPVGGEAAYQQFMPWLQHIAKPERGQYTVTENLLKTLRINTTVVGLGFKFSVGLTQWLSFGNSIEQIGGDRFVKGLLEFYSNPLDMIAQIKEMSPEMATRMHYWDRELRDAYSRLGLEYFRNSQIIKDCYFSILTNMDLLLAYPTWTGGFDKGMVKFKGDVQQAKELADMSVRISQGTAMPKDLAEIQRGPELKKFVTLFYTFFSAQYGQLAEIHTKFKTGEKNVVELFKAWWWILVVPVIIDRVMRDRRMPSMKELFFGIIQYRLAGYPVIRDLASPVFSDYDYQFSPATRAGKVISKTGVEVAEMLKGEPDYDMLFRYGFEAGGYLFGLPTGQALITVQGYNDLKNGDTNDLTRLLLREPRYEEE
ncbi:MAG: hypothetical protein Q8J68_14750 [Methanolobus sp.]|uniref:hypothetical protein n=1 Tax=Methanolobus sp. TaxID=1874737 RepID=UPI0027308F3E|nr:hypothetical protein [Methanolobus sp.]MDP2218534.1 hypothetical protein [Methanolobus sp.]